MIETDRLARASALLDEVKDDLTAERVVGRGPRSLRLFLARNHDRITQAQNLLLGEDPGDPKDN
jgi:plasmid rolling circle replication initiator protein Rep